MWDKILSWSMKGLGVLAILLAPAYAAIGIVFALVVADFILGILAARSRNEPITSTKMKRSISKLLAYEIAICLALLIQQSFAAEWPLIHTVATVIIITELKSLIENFKTITGIDLLGDLLDTLNSLKSINSKNDKK